MSIPAQWLFLLLLQNDFSHSFPLGCQARMQTRQGQLSCQKQSVQLLCQPCILCVTPVLPEHRLGWALYCPPSSLSSKTFIRARTRMALFSCISVLTRLHIGLTAATPQPNKPGIISWRSHSLKGIQRAPFKGTENSFEFIRNLEIWWLGTATNWMLWLWPHFHFPTLLFILCA